jgi:hypothetical protein
MQSYQIVKRDNNTRLTLAIQPCSRGKEKQNENDKRTDDSDGKNDGAWCWGVGQSLNQLPARL